MLFQEVVPAHDMFDPSHQDVQLMKSLISLDFTIITTETLLTSSHEDGRVRHPRGRDTFSPDRNAVVELVCLCKILCGNWCGCCCRRQIGRAGVPLQTTICFLSRGEEKQRRMPQSSASAQGAAGTECFYCVSLQVGLIPAAHERPIICPNDSVLWRVFLRWS